MEFTGERFIPEKTDGIIATEHYHRYLAVIEFLKKNSDKVVLDAASGSGYGTNLMSKFSKKVYGIDISIEAVEYAKNNFSRDNIEFLNSSIESLPFEDNTIDVIVSFETIEHVDLTAQNKFLNEINRVLKKDGVLIISTPNKEVYSDMVNYNNEYHVSEFTKTGFLEFLNQNFEFTRIYNQKFEIFSEISEYQTEEKYTKLELDSTKDTLEKYLIAVCSNIEKNTRELEMTSIMKLRNEITEESFLFFNENLQYNEEEKKGEIINIVDNKFNIKYDISNIDPKDRNKQIRWDPVEGKMCFCRIDEILSDGIILDVVPVNAVEYYEDRFIFLTVDPIFNINGDFSNATYLEIKGEIIFPSNYEISNMINRMYMNLTNIISKLESEKVK